MDSLRPILVLAAGCALFVVVAYDMRRNGGQSWRASLLEAFVVLGLCVWFTSEVLGAFHAITLPALLVAWTLVGAAAVIIAWRPRGERARRTIANDWAGLHQAIKSMPKGSQVALAFAVASACLLALLAFVAAPNTWDSMTYHLSRVMHWQQDRSIAFYPTSVQRQLSFGPLAEMIMLHFQILVGADRIANFVQWFAMLGCVIGTTLITKQLGGDSRAQMLAGIATMTLPMVVLQATSTQNDLVMALWCVCFTALALEAMVASPGWRQILLMGASLGLAILTKVTAMVYLAPIGGWLALELLRRSGVRAWKALAAILCLAAVITAPQALRNYQLFGTPLGPTTGQEVEGLNEIRSLPVLASNIVRNLGMQLALPMEGFNAGLDGILQKVHAVIGIDISDARTTWRQSKFQVVFSTYEDSAGNPLHLAFLAVGALLLIGCTSTRSAVYALCLIFGFVLFCWLLKWQPWNSRLILPFLILALPLAAVAWSDRLPGRKSLLPGLILALGAIPYVILNPTRPVVGADSIFLKDRLQQYFTNVPDSLATYEAAASMIHASGCTRVGLAIPPEGREYLTWVTNAAYGNHLALEHVLVKNVSRRLGTDFDPCAIIVTYPVQESKMTYQDREYERRIDTERFSLFLVASSTP
jgi:hypothetical protein